MKLAIVLLLCGVGFAQTHPDPTFPTGNTTVSSLIYGVSPPDHYVQIFTTGDDLIRIEDKHHKLMVLVKADGKVEYGDNYKPESGAKAFWEDLADSYWGVCNARNQKAGEPRDGH